MQAVVGAYAVWNRRVPTAKLNRWLAGDRRAPPAAGGLRPAHQAPLPDPGQGAPADLRRLLLAARGAARRLAPLPRQRAPRGLRAPRRADPALAPEGREPLRGQGGETLAVMTARARRGGNHASSQLHGAVLPRGSRRRPLPRSAGLRRIPRRHDRARRPDAPRLCQQRQTPAGDRGRAGRTWSTKRERSWPASGSPAPIRSSASWIDDPRGAPSMVILKTLGLFVVTAIAEIVGCYLSVPVAQEGRVGVAPSAGLREPRPLRLAARAASGCLGAGLCGLWRRLCRCRHRMALGHRRRDADRMGHCRGRPRHRRHGGHRLGRLANLKRPGAGRGPPFTLTSALRCCPLDVESKSTGQLWLTSPSGIPPGTPGTDPP